MPSSALNHPNLVIALLCLAGASVATFPANALTLGNVVSQSTLGQPLRVVIPVTLNGGENVTASCLKLLYDGSPGDAPQLVTGRVSFEPGTPTSRVVVTTSRPMNEPALRVSVQSGCGSTMRRDYVLLLDLPMGSDAAPAFQTVAAMDEDAAPVIVPKAMPAIRVARHEQPLAKPLTPITMPARDLAPRPVQAVAAVSAPTHIHAVAVSESSAREVMMTATHNMSSGFISTASAQSLPQIMSSRAPRPSSAPELERLWPYAAMLLCLAGLAMCAVALRRRRAMRAPEWSSTSAHTQSKSPGQSNESQNTFAHYGEMTMPAPIASRPTPRQRETSIDLVPTSGELDTLLNDDLIDEEKIRKEWAAAVSEHALDIGTDSLLQAIATAEREMRIAPPAPAQLAMDNALDEDLLRKPKQR